MSASKPFARPGNRWRVANLGVAILMLMNTTAIGEVPGPGDAFDAARFGFVEKAEDGSTCGIRWAEPRKIRRIMLVFEQGATLPKPEELRIEYWHRVWNGKADPILAERNAGSVGWDAMDDWTNGAWKVADARLVVDGSVWTYTFTNSGVKEFPDVGEDGVGYRKTIKLRVVGEKPLPSFKLKAITDATLQPLTARIWFGRPGDEAYVWMGQQPGSLEVFNGHVLGVRPLGQTNRPIIDGEAHWKLQSGDECGIEADLLMAVDPLSGVYDRTIVTVRAEERTFSFAADEVVRGDRILVDDLGTLVVRGDDAISIDQYRETLREFPGRTLYDRIFDMPEQTLGRAWDHMPLKRPLYFVHGLPGNRNAFRQDVSGSLVLEMDRRWMNLPKSQKDTHRRKWNGTLRLSFGLPSDGRIARELREGYLPELHTRFQDGPVFYEQSTILDALDADLTDISLDDPTGLYVRIHMVNTSVDEQGTARLRLSTDADGRENLAFERDRVDAVHGEERYTRFILNLNGKGDLSSVDGGLDYTLALAPGESHTLYALVPSITVDPEKADSHTRRSFSDVSRRVCDFWRALAERGTQIHTSEPWLDDYYKAHGRHLHINCFKETDSDRLHAHVGTFHYGVYPNESAMMISDLDRRGYHDEARRNLDSFLHYQGTVGMPGTFTSTDGQFYGAGGHETGGYNKSHGYVLWLMAEHWWMTRDREWMKNAAPGLIKGCEWVIQQRRETMKANADGSRPIEYGFLPAGSLEDVTDYWFWLSTNSATVWGMLDLADALADFGHPRGEEMQREARTFYDDYMAGTRESMARCPVVRLRDGTYVPKIPSRLYERGRCHGWLRETLEGSIFLPAYKLLDPAGIESKWILQDYEDNLYISDDYGYSIPAFDTFWFDRGGFSMQANLLDGPLPYLYRDEIRHYVRAVLNGFASAFYPEIRMCNEHSLPELGYPAGDHFKTSDEAQVTYWLRLMFVREEGRDLYLGQGTPRYWLADGQTIGIDRAATHFGPMSLRITSEVSQGRIRAKLTPPTRNAPETTYLRFRHPEQKPIRQVTIDGRPHPRFDAEKEWIILPTGQSEPFEVVAHY